MLQCRVVSDRRGAVHITFPNVNSDPPPLFPVSSVLHLCTALRADAVELGRCQDPLGLGSTEASLSRFQESEVIHGRWAMLGVAGALAVEILGLGNWFDAPLWVRHKTSSPLQTLLYLG